MTSRLSPDGTKSHKRSHEGDSLDKIHPKRSQVVNLNDVHVKLLIPAGVAGAIIGKGGESISQWQKAENVGITLSNPNGYFPGTLERVCLLVGSLASVDNVVKEMIDRIYSRPDLVAHSHDNTSGEAVPRHKQVKIVVPHSTGGMIIGKSGAFVKELMDKSGSHIWLSSKKTDCDDAFSVERVVTISGELEQNKVAVNMILETIAHDPLSNTCPTINYQQIGISPEYTSSMLALENNNYNPITHVHGTPSNNDNYYNQLHNSVPGSHSSIQILANLLQLNTNNGITQQSDLFSKLLNHANFEQPRSNQQIGSVIETVRAFLSVSGYSERAIDEIGGAILNMLSCGFIFLNSNYQGGLQTCASCIPAPEVHVPKNTPFSCPMPSDNYSNFYKPGSVESRKLSQDSGCDRTEVKREMQISDNLVGVILGKGGRDMMELQARTNTTIALSGKGEYVPGTESDRLVTITGLTNGVDSAVRMIETAIKREEARRLLRDSGGGGRTCLK